MPTQCTARKKGTSEQCKAYAVNGTDKCKVHGGLTPVKHGLYSKYTKHRLGDRIQELATDPDLLDLKQQIAFNLALILNKLESLKDTVSNEDAAILATLSERASRNIERLHKLEHGEKYILQVEEVQTVVNQITLIIQQEISDPALVERIADRLQGVRW